MPAHLFPDQNKPCAAAGSICHPTSVGCCGWKRPVSGCGSCLGRTDPSSASPFRMLKTMGVSSRETPVEFWVRHVCVLGCKGR